MCSVERDGPNSALIYACFSPSAPQLYKLGTVSCLFEPPKEHVNSEGCSRVALLEGEWITQPPASIMSMSVPLC